jgi:hypothetical protein
MKTVEVKIPLCVGCGYCCLKAPCCFAVQKYLLDPGERCPSLYWNGEMYRCADYDPEVWEREFGIGCSSSLNTWRQEVKQR